LPDPYIGQWSSGEAIDIVGVPLVVDMVNAAPTVLAPFAAANGGMFDALYVFQERRDNGKWLYRLHRVEESMPPLPPQLQGFSDDRRLPMMDAFGFSAALEAEQRKREWAEHRNG
jgi:hypothetical protein